MHMMLKVAILFRKGALNKCMHYDHKIERIMKLCIRLLTEEFFFTIQNVSNIYI